MAKVIIVVRIIVAALKAFLSTVTPAQWITVVVIPVLILIIKVALPPGPVQDTLVYVLAGLGGLSLNSNRKPSAQGGTMLTAKRKF